MLLSVEMNKTLSPFEKTQVVALLLVMQLLKVHPGVTIYLGTLDLLLQYDMMSL